MADKQEQDEQMIDDVTDETADTEPAVEELDETEALRLEIAELKDTLLRKQADFDNTRKRLRRDMEESGARALVRFVRPFLTELDNFGLAIDAANPEQFQEFAMGVSMIKTNIENLLSGAGIESIPAEGHFDPHFHEVVQEQPTEGVDKGVIVGVLRQGYKLGSQVIRAAQVVVAAGPSEPAPATEDADGADGGEASADTDTTA